MAHSTIILSLTDGVLKEVSSEKTIVGLRNTLENRIQKSLWLKDQPQRRSFIHYKWKKSSISNYTNTFNKFTLDLEDINVKIDDENKTRILFCSLPSSYEYHVNKHIYGR